MKLFENKIKSRTLLPLGLTFGLVSFIAASPAEALAGASCQLPQKLGRDSLQNLKSKRDSSSCGRSHCSGQSGNDGKSDSGGDCGGGGNKKVPNTVQCGDRITSGLVVLTQDLICPTTTGNVLTLVGTGIVFEGNGHKIVAPNAASSIYVQGSNVTVRNTVVSGNGSTGIFAYDSPGLTLRGNDASGNIVGIDLYAENTLMSGVTIDDNISHGNSLYGLRTGQDGAGSIDSPTISGNDLSYSGSYAMLIEATNYELGPKSRNSFYKSVNGILLSTGSFYIHDIALTDQLIQDAQIFAENAVSVRISNVDVSTNLAPNSLERHMGVDLYHVASFDIECLIANHNDAGVRLETDGGISPSGKVSGSSFGSNQYAGISVVSYDGTPYGVLNFKKNKYNELDLSQDVVLAPGTQVGAGSTLQ